MPHPSADIRSVAKVRVVVHKGYTGHGHDPDSVNHWSIYLVLRHHKSVRMNIVGLADRREAVLEYSSYDYTHPRSEIRSWDFHVTQSLEVQHFFDVVKHYQRDKYWMTEKGRGCRYWCYTVITDFVRWHYLSSSTTPTLWSKMQYWYKNSGRKIPIEWEEGTWEDPGESD